MMMNRKRQLALVIGACMVASSLLMLVPMAKPWVTQDTSTSATKSSTLGIGQVADFAFNNATNTTSFTCVVGNASTLPGYEYNLTAWADNGTQLRVRVYVTHMFTSSGCNWQDPAQIGSTLGPFGGFTQGGVRQNASTIITAVTQETLCIEVDWAGYVATPWSSNGGSIVVRAISGYSQSYALAFPVSGANTFGFQNVSALTTPDGSVSYYAQEFNVSANGFYYLQANGTGLGLSGINMFPDFTLYVLEKSAGIPDLQSQGFAGTYQTISKSGPNVVGGYTFSANTTKYTNDVFLSMALTTGKTYVLVLVGLAGINSGELQWCNVTALPSITGSLGTPTALDFSSASAVKLDDSDYLMIVTLPTPSYDTLYAASLSMSSSNWPWYFSTYGLFSLGNGGVFNNMQALNGAFLVTQDTSPALTVDGQAMPKANPEFNMVRDWSYFSTGSPNYNVSSVPIWTQISVLDNQWATPIVAIIASNNTYTGTVTSPSKVNLLVDANATNVPAFTGTASSGDSSYFTKSFAFSNNGGVDNMGLYKITGEQGKELQMQVTSISAIPDQGGSGNSGGATNAYSLAFASGDIMFTGFAGPIDVESIVGVSMSFDNTSYTWSTNPAHPEFDSAKIYPMPIFTDPVYVLVKSTVMGDSMHPSISNSSSFSLNWTYAPFLASGQSFVVSRDFPFAIYDINLPVAGLATLTTVYGPCTISYAPVEFIPAPLTNCWFAHTYPFEGYPVMYATPNGASFTGGFHAYLIVLGYYVAPHGSVLQLTITATIDWLSWGIAIAALVALVIVVIVLSRKK